MFRLKIIPLMCCMMLLSMFLAMPTFAATEAFDAGTAVTNPVTYAPFVYTYRDGSRAIIDTIYQFSVGGSSGGILLTSSGGGGSGQELSITKSGGGTFTFIGIDIADYTSNINVAFRGYDNVGAKIFDSGDVAIPFDNGANFANHITYTLGTPFSSITELRIVSTSVNGLDPMWDNFQYSLVSPPTVTNINPTSGTTLGGTSVIITGANLTAASAVKFGANNATGYTVNSATQITATTPVGSAGTVNITVTTAGGTSATSASDQYTYTAPPSVTTQAVSSIASITATGNGNITNLGTTNPTQYGVVWNTATGPTTANSKTTQGAIAATGAFTSSMTSLTPNTTYYVKAYATNASGTSYGTEVSFTTSPVAPTVTTQAVSAIAATTATGNGNITSLGAPNPTQYGVVWNTTGTPTTADPKTTQGVIAATGAFTSSMTGLTANTTYYVRAYATNTAGTSYGSEVSFTTSAVAPTVTTQAISAIAATTATGNGTISSLGVPNPTQYGVVWDIVTGPTVALGTKTNQGAIAATGAFTSSMTGLTANTTYYVRAYATNTAGTSYGTEVSFTTSGIAAAVTAQAVSAITSTTATGNGNITSLGTPNPSQYGVVWNTTGTPTTADSKTTQGAIAATGAFTSSMTGLTFNTTYYVRAYVTNTAGTSYGNEVSFTTSGIAPTVTTQAASAISATFATGNGNITATNGANATTRGVIYYAWTNSDLIIGVGGVTNVAEVGSFGTGAFTAFLTPLAVNIQYNARAYAISPNGTGYGARVAFWTLANVPAASTVNNATATTLDVAVNVNANPASTEFAIQETGTGNYVQIDGTLGAAAVWQNAAIWGTKTVTGLTTGTTYTFQVKARNGGLTETAFGATASGVPVAAPSVTTQAASVIAATSATGNGTITSLGSPNPTQFGVVWSTTTGPTIASSKTTQGATSVTGVFTSSMTGLAASTTYYVRAYATNTVGTSYGSEVSFTTSVAAPTVTGISPTSGSTAGGTSITITGTDLSGATAVTIGGVAASGVTVSNATTITAVTPAGTLGAQDVIVTTPGGSGTGSSLFTYKNPQTVNFPAFGVKSYGNADFDPGATATSTLAVSYASNNLSVATITAGGVVHIVGAGSATITANQAGSATVGSASAQRVLTVNKAVLSVSADNKSRDYSAANPTFSASYSGFVLGEDVSALSGAPALATVADASSPVGSYVVTSAIGSLSAANYSFTFVNGTLGVGLASQTIVFNPLPAKTYGAASYDLSATGGASGNPVTFSSSNPLVATISGVTVTITGAGSADIMASQIGNGNYASATTQQTLTVNKATVTVTADSANRLYNDVNPVFTVSYGGFVNGQNAAVLTGAPAMSTTATPASPVGNYPITVGSGTLEAANYDFTLVNGTLAVGIASQAIIFDPLADRSYGGEPFTLSASTSSGLNVTFASSNSAVATVSGAIVTIVGAGSTTITASQGGDISYATASAQQVLTVKRASLAVTAQDATRIYGTANPVFTTVYSGFVNGDTVTVLAGVPVLSTTATAVSPVGNYPIIAAAGNLFANNYTFTYGDGILTVGAASQTISSIAIIPNSIQIGGSCTVNATASSTLPVSFSSSTSAICTVSGTTVTGVSAGTCVITASQSGNATYPAAVPVNQNLTVTYNSTPPNLLVSALSAGATTTDTTQNVSGRVLDINGIASVTINGITVQRNTGGSFSFPVQLLAGANSVSVAVTNLAGSTTTETRIITLDSTAPHLTVSFPPDNVVAFKRSITVVGTLTDLLSGGKAPAKAVALDSSSTVSYSINGSAAQGVSLTDTSYSFTTDLADGMNTIQISAATPDGKKVETKRTVSYQVPTFSLSITDPAADIRMVQGSYLLSGRVADNTSPVAVTISMDGQTFTPPVQNGVFKQQLNFTEDKTYQISVSGTDQSGNTLSVQRNIIRTLPKTTDGVAAPFTIVDALQALQMNVGTITPDTGQLLRMDVAPMQNGISVGDGKIDVEDVLVILYLAIGLI